ncbi:hypothetical protein BX667DRAFT_509293 [Coemansia mojavensis]|nr:hypothetical protein BX667DRAFT_509293 [Coemansia mojavensis]
MTNFCSLPDDIYLMVINKLHAYKKCPSGMFKSNLFLLEISPRFRHLAVPLVYRTVFVIYGKENRKASGYLIDKPVDEPVQGISTNIELARHIGIDVASKVYIIISYLGNPLVGFEKVLELLTDVHLPAKELQLALQPAQFVASSRRADPNDHAQQVSMIVANIMALLPHVTKLSFNGYSSDKMAQVLSGKIAKDYADQLQKLHCMDAPKAYFANLKDASMDMNRKVKFKSPTLNNEVLEELYMINVSIDMDWSSLVVNGNLEFPNLHRLTILYDHTNLQAKQSYRIVLPKLKSLFIFASDACPILKQAVLPASMNSIDIRIGSRGYRSLKDITLPKAKSVTLRTGLGGDGNGKAVFYMCQLLGNAQGGQKITLSIVDPAIPVLAENITCTLITNMIIAAPTSTETFLALLGKLPRLSALSLYRARFDDAMEVIPAASEPCLPLNQQLKTVQLRYRSAECSAEIMVHALAYLVPRLVNLKNLTAAQVPQDMLFEQLMPLQSQYSHIGNVDYKLRKADTSNTPANATG